MELLHQYVMAINSIFMISIFMIIGNVILKHKKLTNTLISKESLILIQILIKTLINLDTKLKHHFSTLNNTLQSLKNR